MSTRGEKRDGARVRGGRNLTRASHQGATMGV